MKTYRHLYPQVCAWENLFQAWRKARKGKRGREPAASFEYDLEANLLCIQRELRAKTYRPSPYTSFYVHDPKRRLRSPLKESAPRGSSDPRLAPPTTRICQSTCAKWESLPAKCC